MESASLLERNKKRKEPEPPPTTGSHCPRETEESKNKNMDQVRQNKAGSRQIALKMGSTAVSRLDVGHSHLPQEKAKKEFSTSKVDNLNYHIPQKGKV